MEDCCNTRRRKTQQNVKSNIRKNKKERKRKTENLLEYSLEYQKNTEINCQFTEYWKEKETSSSTEIKSISVQRELSSVLI